MPIDNHFINLTIPTTAYHDSLKHSVHDYLDLNEPIVPTYQYIKKIDSIDLQLNLINQDKKGVIINGTVRLSKMGQSLKMLLSHNNIKYSANDILRIESSIIPWSDTYERFDSGSLKSIYSKVYPVIHKLCLDHLVVNIDRFLDGLIELNEVEGLLYSVLVMITQKDPKNSFPIIDFYRLLVVQYDLDQSEILVKFVFDVLEEWDFRVAFSSLRLVLNLIGKIDIESLYPIIRKLIYGIGTEDLDSAKIKSLLKYVAKIFHKYAVLIHPINLILTHF